MPRSHPAPHMGAQNSLMVGGGGDASYVSADKLKQVNAPMQGLMGLLNGGISGLALSAGVSALATYGNLAAGQGLIKSTIQNIKGSHMLPVLATTTAIGLLGAAYRYTSASDHNKWSEDHYSFLEQQTERETSAAVAASQPHQVNHADRHHQDHSHTDRFARRAEETAHHGRGV